MTIWNPSFNPMDSLILFGIAITPFLPTREMILILLPKIL